MHFLLVRLGVKNLNKVKKLIDMGFRVSVTGGLDVDTLKLFEGVDVFTFIAGRGITEAADPAGARVPSRMKSDEFGVNHGTSNWNL